MDKFISINELKIIRFIFRILLKNILKGLFLIKIISIFFYIEHYLSIISFYFITTLKCFYFAQKSYIIQSHFIV